MSQTAPLTTKTIIVTVNYKKHNNRTNRFENKTRILKLKK